MKNRILALILTVLVLSVTACASDETPNSDPVVTTAAPSTTDAPAETTVPESTQLRYDTQGKTYNGHIFRMWNFDNATSNGWTDVPDDLDTAELNGEVLNDAVYRRNALVENQLGITIEGVAKKTATFDSDLSKMVLANTDEADAIFPRMKALATFAGRGNLADLNAIDTFDFTQPWWNQDSVESLSLYGKLFGVASDAAYMHKMATTVAFFNQRLVTDYGMGDMYQLVKDGNWTFDKMLEFGAQVSRDLDNDGAWTAADAYGISCQNDGSYYFFNASGLRICDKDESGNIVFNLNSELAINTLQKFYAVKIDESMYFNRMKAATKLDLPAVAAMFGEGRALFLVRPVQTLFTLRNVNAEFGVLPMPKMLDGQKEYYSTINPNAGTVMAIPSSVADLDRSATVLSLLACESHYSVTEALHETVLGAKLVQDSASAEVLDMTFDSVMFDIGVCNDFAKITTTLNNINTTNIASSMKAQEKAINKAIETYSKSLQ